MITLGMLLAALAGAPPAASTPPATIHFAGETTDGTTVSFPDAAHGKALILIVTFTREAGKRAEPWSDALAAHALARASIVGVAVLDRVPGFLRGMIRKAIAKDVGPPQTGKPGFVTTIDAVRCAPRRQAATPTIRSSTCSRPTAR